MAKKKSEKLICDGDRTEHQCDRRHCRHRKPHLSLSSTCGYRQHNGSDRFCDIPGTVSLLDGDIDGSLVTCIKISEYEKILEEKKKNQFILNQASATVHTFRMFMSDLGNFRYLASLKDVEDVQEICNSMTDKHGRICRHVKHMERNDPKPEWPSELLESIFGFLVYSYMLINHYKLWGDVHQCMLSELKKSIRQHSKKESD